MDGDKSVTAHFVQSEYTLTTNVEPSGGGSVTADHDGPYEINDIVALTAVPNAGWAFDGWSGDLTGSDNPTSITMDGDKSVTAHFIRTEYTLTVNIDPSGGGSVSTDHAGPYEINDIVALTAAPNTGWAFAGWSGDLTGSDNPTSIAMDGDKSVTAHFVQSEYTLTTNVEPSGGGSVTADPHNPYHYNDIVELTAVPNDGWSFDGWSGDLTGSDNPQSITMDGNKGVTATFTEASEGELTLESFVISRMTIDWAKDKEKQDKKWSWGLWFRKFFKFFSKKDDKFSISGRAKLPEDYTVHDLENLANITIALADDTGNDSLVFNERSLRKASVMWNLDNKDKHPGNNMEVSNATFWWAPDNGNWGGWVGFHISGTLRLPEDIGVNTEPAIAQVIIELPASTNNGGSFVGSETLSFKVSGRSNKWVYNPNQRLPYFPYEPGEWGYDMNRSFPYFTYESKE